MTNNSASASLKFQQDGRISLTVLRYSDLVIHSSFLIRVSSFIYSPCYLARYATIILN